MDNSARFNAHFLNNTLAIKETEIARTVTVWWRFVYVLVASEVDGIVKITDVIIGGTARAAASGVDNGDGGSIVMRVWICGVLACDHF